VGRALPLPQAVRLARTEPGSALWGLRPRPRDSLASHFVRPAGDFPPKVEKAARRALEKHFRYLFVGRGGSIRLRRRLGQSPG
jgi:hypothetical protein